MSKIFKHSFTFLFIILGFLILLFILVPLFKMVFLSDKEAMWLALLDSETIQAVWLSIYAALIATAIGFVLGVPLAYLFARYEFPGKNIFEGLIDLPIVVPHSAAGIALLFVFGSNFIVGKGFKLFGIQFVDSLAGIIIAMLFVSVPILISSAKESFRKVDVRLEKVARTLGASPWQTFFRISFPLAWRSILAGSLMMWARGMSEFGAVIILTYHPTTAPVLIYERFETFGLAQAIPVAAIMIIISAVVFIGVQTLLRWRKNYD
ncbi:MAG TPA: ABC transporter permease [Syntrophomonadaceae bacterium]|nr:ABC transporter permease [Syntrophomonadaceae bacterium]